MMANTVPFKFGGKIWTAIYSDDYELINLLDGDSQENFLSARAVEKAEDVVFEQMMADKSFRRKTKPIKEPKHKELY